MKLLGITDGKKVVASMGHYDCRFFDNLMADGGQPHTFEYAGYNRFSRGAGCNVVWFEVPQNFAELYQDYNCNKPRQYGIWDIENVKVLSDEKDWPDCDSFEEKAKNAIWGTYGVDGDEDLHYILLSEASTDHLNNILKTERASDERQKTIKLILSKR